jgi:hypothetical protein
MLRMCGNSIAHHKCRIIYGILCRHCLRFFRQIDRKRDRWKQGWSDSDRVTDLPVCPHASVVAVVLAAEINKHLKSVLLFLYSTSTGLRGSLL